MDLIGNTHPETGPQIIWETRNNIAFASFIDFFKAFESMKWEEMLNLIK